MTPRLPPKLVAAMTECELHARVLQAALDDLPAHFGPADVATPGEPPRRILDQAAYRFMMQAAAWTRFLAGVRELLATWAAASAAVQRLAASA